MNNLRKLRKQRKLTLDDIQKQTQINRGTYNNYENGTTEPKPETWQALADFFGVSVPYLQGAYSKEEINKKVIASYNEYFEAYNIKKLFLIVQPLNGWTIEDYLIAAGAVPFDTPKAYVLINKDQMEDDDFSKKNLEPIYKNVAVKWLL